MTESKILIACEESQAVTKELRKLGHEAYSCDILPASGGHPEWHLQQDVMPLLKEDWGMIIAFPPCTYLTVTGNRWFNIDKYGEKARQRHRFREEAWSLPKEERGRLRGITFPGVAEAMAKQWGDYIKK